MGGPCSNILCISLLPLWYPWGPTFHDTAFSTELVETEPAILRLTSQLSLCTFSVLAVLNSIQRFHPTRIRVRLACCFLAYVPVKPNMFSVSEPNSIISLLSRLWIQEPTLALRARKNSTINFQESLGAWVRQRLVVSPSGMASHSSSSESQSLQLSWRDLILGKVRNGSVSLTGSILGSCRVGSSDVPRFPTPLTTSSMESVASAFRKIQFDRSIGAHVRELGVILRSACNIPFGMGLFR